MPTPLGRRAMKDIVFAREPTPLLHVRSTILVSGVAEFRARGHYSAYVARLDDGTRETILGMIAGEWLSVDVAMKHFEAVEGLGLTPEEAFEIGGASARRFRASLWGTLLRVAVSAGADPWVFLRAYDRVWARAFDGGGFVVTQTGPKEVMIELRSIPFCRYEYFRNAFRGTNDVAMGAFASTLYVREVTKRTHPNGFTIRVAWV